MNNEKDIIVKLLAIAKNQQKVIHKLAQAQGLSASPDPVADYLKSAVDAAAANSGVAVPINVTVKANAGSQQGNVQVEGTYTVTINGMAKVDNTTKERFLKTYKTQIKTQKPELDGKVSVLFS